ncbi:alpha/beta fold hydrolase [Agrococcus casei]|uniref:alpha/beta fold hydrolase n=1 Tax=Agrococcus casei TaxID=343512 RepID=UPI003F91A8A7
MPLVDIGGRRLSVFDSPAQESAGDVVVFESGLGASGAFWQLVERELQGCARLVSYDRAGYGTSDAAQGDRGLEALADDLDALLETLRSQRLVLVGHSWGGPIVRLVARRRRARGQDVTGLVLVDPSDEGASMFFGRAFAMSDAMQRALSVPLARTGLLRRLYGTVLKPLTGELLDAVAEASASVTAARASNAELLGVTAGLEGLLAHPEAETDAPVTVISGARSGRSDRRQRAELIRAHQRRAVQARNGRHVLAPHSGHMVPLSEPEVVADEVRRLLA